MRRGLAGLIAVLLMSGFVASTAGPSAEPFASARDPQRAAPRSPKIAQTTASHDHASHAHAASSLTPGSRSPGEPSLDPVSSASAANATADLSQYKQLCGGARPALVGNAITCTHGGDEISFASSSTAASVAPTCHGDGVTGRRVRLVYAYPAGAPDRSAEVVPQIRDAWAPAIEGLVRAESKAAGSELGVRFYMPGCALDVWSVKVSANTADTAAGTDAMFDRIANSLTDQGADDYTQKYLIWFDGYSGSGACGIAYMIPVDDSPAPTNSHNGVSPVFVRAGLPTGVFFGSPNFAVTFRQPGTDAADAPGCWGRQGAHTETHELFHNLGAVQLSAPNTDGAGHCLDALDVMCYDSKLSAKPMRPSCFGSFAFLDCNKDDYFNPRPPVGSYLSTHWNTANSGFLAQIGSLSALPLP